MRPVDAWTGFDMPFEVVGVKLHETGQQEIAVTIARACRYMGALFHGGDDAVLESDTAGDDPILQDKLGIGEALGI